MLHTAVDAATDGDVIKIAQGTYTGIDLCAGVTQVVCISMSVTIHDGYASMEDFYNPSVPWIYTTVINAQDKGRAVYVAEDATFTLEGLHIFRGNGIDLRGGRGPS